MVTVAEIDNGLRFEAGVFSRAARPEVVREEQNVLVYVIAFLIIVCTGGCGGSLTPPTGGGGPQTGVDQWVRLAPGPLARQEVAVAALDNSVFVIGGLTAASQPASDVQIYDAAADSWMLTTPIPVPVHHAGAVWVGGKLYVFGGFAGPSSAAIDQTFIFDPQSRSWTAGPTMLETKGAFAIAADNRRVYLIGGVRGNIQLASVDEFYTSSSTWRVLPSMPTPRNHVVAGIVGGGILVVGGRDNTTSRLTATEFFDLTTQQWRSLPPMPTGRSGSAAAVFGSRFYVFGGEVNPSSTSGVFANSEYFDMAEGQWHTALSMEVPKHGTGAAVVGNRIIIPQGATAAGIGPTSSCEAYVVNL